MAKGWEVAIRVQENHLGFSTTIGSFVRPGWFLFVDSETLKKNSEIKERDAKIIPMRLSPVQTANMEQQSPGGEVTFQPRSDDCVNILMAFFQTGTFMHGGSLVVNGGTGGTWVFTPIHKSLGWNGTQFGTSHIYPINVDKYYGEGLTGTGDGIRFERGVVSKLSITQEPAADLVMAADMRFLQATDEAPFGTGFKSMPNSLGSFSSKNMFIDWNGTITVGGNTYAIERIKWDFDNTITERRKLGQRGFYQFPFGRAIFSGEFDLELEDMSAFKEGTTGGTIACRWQTTYGDWIEIFAPNVFWRASDANVSDTGPVMRTIGFRCYPTGFGSSNAVTMSVYPYYGSLMATLGPPVQSKLWFNI